MTTAMGPPPPRNPTTTTSGPQAKTSEEPSTSSSSSSSSSESTKSSMGPPPPPPKFTNPPPPERETEPQSDTSASKSSQLDDSLAIAENVADTKDSTTSTTNDEEGSLVRKQGHGFNDTSVPYTIPPWNGPPCHQYFLEVLKDGAIIDQFEVNKKGAYMFGRVDLCDFVLEHPTISRFHAVIQFKSNGEAYLYDLGSTHGTYINKNQVKKKAYVGLNVGDVIRFGQSSRLYIFQGPADLMPPEADLKSMQNAKIQKEMKDMEASLLRAKLEASMADGISWGMQEDAIEEAEDEVDEITWQNFKGQLTEKQEKTREKVLKRLEKIAHMKKEIDAIRAKDIAQGGLTQGQQTQIARNEQRISQIMEELENLEETLNDSIRESLGARAGKTTRGKRTGSMGDDEEDYVSDDDEFYDRTKKPTKRKSDENQSIETADSLLGRKEEILNEMETKKKLHLDEDEIVHPNEVSGEGDALDAYMSSVSSQLALDKKDQLQKDLAYLQSELDRVLFLLKIADPTGEAARKRDSKAQEPIPNMKIVGSDSLGQRPSVKGQNSRPENSSDGSDEPQRLHNSSIDTHSIANVTAESSLKLEGSEIVTDVGDDVTIIHTVVKPQWLGAVDDLKKQETIEEAPLDTQERENFVDYKDRNTILEKADHVNEPSGLESAAPGLIIRKRKQVEIMDISDAQASEKSKEAKLKVEDTLALLLKHSKANHASDEVELQTENVPTSKHARKNKKTPKGMLGPARPSFLSNESDYESWVPPEDQSGDGRTSLNDRFGY